MNLNQFLDFINQTPRFSQCIQGTHTIPEKPAEYVEIPGILSDPIKDGIREIGYSRLYSHQGESIERAVKGENVLIVTPTASGKSLTYIVPLFERKMRNPHSRAILLFPTKALAQDQLSAIDKFNEKCRTNYKIFTYDGDTEPAARRKIVEAGDFVITNPDMLHAGILPHHTVWVKLFENLDFIVMDEIHTYKGVFGSHVANMMRRLLRIARFYGSDPQILAASATIGNPLEHAQNITEKKFYLIDKSGAPQGKRNIIFYNPPVVNQALGIRASAVKEAADLGSFLIKNKISTILFCRSRLRVELLYSYLRERSGALKDKIRAYRGGYLPSERRKIEKELREGSVISVVSTNALELGVDIGALEVSITLGFPGSISSVWQQFGRAGRRGEESLSVLMATSDGTDQYLTNHPEFFIERNPENVMINPDNLLIISDHLKCAAFEIPFREGETFGDYKESGEILDYLSEHNVLHKSKDQYHWVDDVYPANTFGLRSGAKENFVIIDITEPGKERVIGEIDLYAAPTMVHKDAIYIHQGQQYYVEDLMWEERQARVKRINEDYFTDAHEKIDISILDDDERQTKNWIEIHRGELLLRIKAVMFKKLKLETHENIGWGEIHTPEIEMHTQGAWVLFAGDFSSRLKIDESVFGSVLSAVAYSLGIVAPVYVMSDPRDIRFRSEMKSPSFRKPAIYFYDAFPGGLEMSYKIMENLSVIAGAAYETIDNCICENGCPACTGVPDNEANVKELGKEVLKMLF